jgi:hypothetical protein
MPNNSLISISTDNALIQQLFWDTSTKKIEVVHEINLEPGKGARWSRKTTYLPAPGDPIYDGKCKAYNINPKDKKYITEYEYDEYPDNRDYPIAVKFPVNGSYYPLSELPHVVVAIYNRTSTGQVSKTSGEAL